MLLPVVNPAYVGEYARSPGFANYEGVNILFVGRLIEDKGVITLAEAVGQVVDTIDDVSLTYIGEGPAEEALVSSIADLGIKDNVALHGKLPHRQTLDQMARHDILVLPSRSEGVPRVIIEAFEIGLPVIATPVGGITDVIDHETTGLLVEEDPTEIARAIEKLAIDRENAAVIASNAAQISEQWTWSMVESQVSSAYESATR